MLNSGSSPLLYLWHQTKHITFYRPRKSIVEKWLLSIHTFWASLFVYKNVYIFGCTGSWLWHAESLVAAWVSFFFFFLSCGFGTLSCGIWDLFSDQGSNPSSLHWEHGVLAPGPPGKSPEPIWGFNLHIKEKDSQSSLHILTSVLQVQFPGRTLRWRL